MKTVLALLPLAFLLSAPHARAGLPALEDLLYRIAESRAKDAEFFVGMASAKVEAWRKRGQSITRYAEGTPVEGRTAPAAGACESVARAWEAAGEAAKKAVKFNHDPLDPADIDHIKQAMVKARHEAAALLTQAHGG